MYRFQIQWLWTLAALSVTALGAVPALGQTAARSSVTVAVLYDYPAFRPPTEQGDPRARGLRALVVRRDPAGGNNSIVILNPAYLTAQTLGNALMALQDRTGGKPGTQPNNLIALGTSHPARPLTSQTVSTLNAKLAELRAQPASHIYKLGAVGRSIVISDLSQYLPSDK